MSRTSTLQRIAISAIATLALAGSAASSALADDRAITTDPEPGTVSWAWCQKDPDGFQCKIGSIRVACRKAAWGPWSCGGCTSCAKPTREDEPEVRALIEEVEAHLARMVGDPVEIRW